jgi:hypothetical protein
MEEGVLHIQLLKQPVAGGSNGEHRAHGGQFDNCAESLIVVHTRALHEPLEDPVSLVVVEGPIRDLGLLWNGGIVEEFWRIWFL